MVGGGDLRLILVTERGLTNPSIVSTYQYVDTTRREESPMLAPAGLAVIVGALAVMAAGVALIIAMAVAVTRWASR